MAMSEISLYLILIYYFFFMLYTTLNLILIQKVYYTYTTFDIIIYYTNLLELIYTIYVTLDVINYTLSCPPRFPPVFLWYGIKSIRQLVLLNQ